jgi:hypothetical protein
VRDYAQVQALFDATLRGFAPVDILVNTAGSPNRATGQIIWVDGGMTTRLGGVRANEPGRPRPPPFARADIKG